MDHGTNMSAPIRADVLFSSDFTHTYAHIYISIEYTHTRERNNRQWTIVTLTCSSNIHRSKTVLRILIGEKSTIQIEGKKMVASVEGIFVLSYKSKLTERNANEYRLQ